MTIKLLVSVEDARARLQISDEIDPPSLVANIESAVAAAQLHVAALLECEFSSGTGVATFFLDQDSFSNVRPGGVFRLYLPTGFISNVSLLQGDSWNACTDTVDAGDYEVDAERGVIRVDEMYHKDQYIKVSYSFGVTASTCPDWLAEAILSFVPVKFFLSTTNTKENPGPDFKTMEQHANLLLDSHLRKAGFCIRAIK